MDNATDLKRPFRATIETSLAALGRLREHLAAEQRALRTRDVEALEQAVRAKRQCLEMLEHSIKARDQILSQLGLPDGLGGTEQFLSSHFSPEELLSEWQQLTELSREVAELNLHNGKLAVASERITREALAILTGRPLSPDTYARKPRSSGGGISLGKC